MCSNSPLLAPFLLLLSFLWYICHSYYIAIGIYSGFFLKNLRELGILPYFSNMNKFFLWFDNIENRTTNLKKELKEYLKNLNIEQLMLTPSSFFTGPIHYPAMVSTELAIHPTHSTGQVLTRSIMGFLMLNKNLGNSKRTFA